jgi:DNA modification methylase
MDRIRIEYMATDRLIPYVNNPRKNDKAVDVVAGSIQEFGFKNPIIVDKDNVIVAGHTRLLAARKLELEEVPVIRAEDLTEQQIKAFRLADNKTAEFAEWDMELLALELEGLDDIFTGFNEVEIADILGLDNEAQEDDFDVDAEAEKIIEPETKPGDVWLLGRHRLMCGDATKIKDVERLVDGRHADLVLTDPPYNVDYEGGTKDKLKIQNDKMEDSRFLQFLTDAFTRMNENSKKGAAIYVFHSDSEGYNFRSAFKAAGYSLRQCLIWAKNTMVMGRQDYHWQHEPILYGWKEGAKHAWYGDRKQTTLIRYDKPLRNAEHPTMKPVGLCGYLIGNSSKEEDIVLDLFGGSGSTLIAAEQLNRTCYMMELDPVYCEVIVQRYINLKGHDGDVYLERDGNKIAF